MRKLIIGCGYLGRRVARAWLAQNHDVAALTRSSAHAGLLREAGIVPVLGDVTRPETLTKLPAAETVLHAVGFDRTADASMHDVYVQGLRHVLEVIAPTTRRFLYISSVSVYGQSAGEWVDEDSPCEPTRENGRICREAEQLVRQFFPPPLSGPQREGDAPCAHVLRLAGLYGPGRVLRRIQAVRAGEPIPGNPDAYLNLIHVDDACRAVLACEEHGLPGRTYLVVDDAPLRRRDYFHLLSRLLNAAPPAFDESMTTAAFGKAGLNKRCRNRRLKQELHVRLEYPTAEQGLSAIIPGETAAEECF